MDERQIRCQKAKVVKPRPVSIQRYVHTYKTSRTWPLPCDDDDGGALTKPINRFC